MLGFLASAGGSLLSNILGGIIGNSASSKEREAAQRASEKALAEIEAIGAPPDLAREIILQRFESEGVWSPQIEQEINVGMSKVAEIQESAEPRAAQMAALKKFQETSETGFTPETRAMMAQAQADAAKTASARTQQILSQQRQRGLASSGSELAALLQMGAAASAEESDAALRSSAMASQAALQSAAQTGQLGGQIRSQDFGVAREKAEAADRFAMQQFNERVSRQGRNIASLNEAARYNLAQKQRLSEANVAQINAEKQRQRQAEDRQYQLAMQRAGMRSAAYGSRAQQLQQQAGQTQQGYSNIFGGVAQGVSAIGQQFAADKRHQDEMALKRKELELEYGNKDS